MKHYGRAFAILSLLTSLGLCLQDCTLQTKQSESVRSDTEFQLKVWDSTPKVLDTTSSLIPIVYFTSESLSSGEQFGQLLTFAGRVIVVQMPKLLGSKEVDTVLLKTEDLLKSSHIYKIHLVLEGTGCGIGFLYAQNLPDEIMSLTFMNGHCAPYTEDHEALSETHLFKDQGSKIALSTRITEAFEFLKLTEKPKLVFTDIDPDSETRTFLKSLHKGFPLSVPKSKIGPDRRSVIARTLTNWFLKFQR
jgi:hypothetical protein